MKTKKVKLGNEVKDVITDFTGIVVAKCKYLFGCAQIGISPKINKDGLRKETEWFDKGRIKFVNEGVHKKEVQSAAPGSENTHPKNT